MAKPKDTSATFQTSGVDLDSLLAEARKATEAYVAESRKDKDKPSEDDGIGVVSARCFAAVNARRFIPVVHFRTNGKWGFDKGLPALQAIIASPETYKADAEAGKTVYDLIPKRILFVLEHRAETAQAIIKAKALADEQNAKMNAEKPEVVAAFWQRQADDEYAKAQAKLAKRYSK